MSVEVAGKKGLKQKCSKECKMKNPLSYPEPIKYVCFTDGEKKKKVFNPKLHKHYSYNSNMYSFKYSIP